MANTTKKHAAQKPTAAADEGNFSAAERAAMKERAKEVRAKKKGAEVDTEAEVLAKIAEFQENDRVMGEWVHKAILAAVPTLVAKLWYGMPAYYKDGKMLCFFQPSSKFKTRYGVLGFGDVAALDEGTMWPTYYALMSVNAGDEKKIAELVVRAAG